MASASPPATPRAGGPAGAPARPRPVPGAGSTESDANLRRLADFLRSGRGSGFIEARAGSGKTTAILHALQHVPHEGVACLMFNRRIMEELGEKIQDGAGASRRVFTFHAFGRRIWFDHVKALARQPDAEDADESWDSSLNCDDDDLDDLENDPDYWTADLQDDGEEGDDERSAEARSASRGAGDLIRLDGAKMSKILKSLHGEEVEAAMKRKVPPPVPSIPDLNKAFRLRHLVSLARCNAIPPPLDPVQHLVVDTSRNLRDLLQPLPPPAVETPTDFASLFRFYGKKFEHKDFAHLPLDAVERRVVQVLGMAMRRAVGWALEPRRKHVVDFDDLIYLPVLVRGVKFPRLKFVFVDEAQDLSLMRIELVRRCLDQGGRLVAVGDRHQSIYAWAGSLPNSLDHLPHSFGALTRFDLPITWRCPALHVEATMQMANLLQRPVRLDARPGAARGALEYRPGIWDIDSPDAGQAAAAIFRPGDLVLARLNQPLKLLAWKLGEWGIPHTCSAVNVGSRLAAFLRKHGAAVPRFPDPYHEGSAVPLAELRAIAAAKVTDKPLDPGSLLVRIIDRLLASATGPGPAVGHALFEELHRLYPALSPGHSPGAAGAAHLSTVHKAKGLERARVVIVQPWDCPFFPRGERGAMQWEREQEANLIYVALTRSKAELLLVDINCGPLSWKYGKLDWLHKKNSEAFRRAFGGAEARVPRVAAPTPAAVHVAPVQAAPATPVKRKNQLQEPTPAAVHIAPTAPVQAVPATPVKRKNQPQEPTPASTTPPSKKQRPPPRTPETPTRARRAIRADSDDEVGMSDGNEGMSDGDFSVGQKSPRKKGSQRGRGKGGRGGRKK